jgi:hypothetical protein
MLESSEREHRRAAERSLTIQCVHLGSCLSNQFMEGRATASPTISPEAKELQGTRSSSPFLKAQTVGNGGQISKLNISGLQFLCVAAPLRYKKPGSAFRGLPM